MTGTAPRFDGPLAKRAPLLAWLYAAATLLLLVPAWTAVRVPTLDGPCHLYNAFVMHHLHDPAYPLFARHFTLSFAPIPNWLIQALLYGLVGVLPLAIAEKVLVSLYVVVFAAAAWAFAGCQERARAPWAFLALPFVWTEITHYGFYNFVLSVPLALLAVALWWRWRDRLGWRQAAILAALLLLTYFAHLVALGEALVAIAVLWLVDFGPERRQGPALRRWLLHPLLLAPQLVLPLWYVWTHASEPAPAEWPLPLRALYFADLGALFDVGFGAAQQLLHHGFALLLLVLAIATLRGLSPSAIRDYPFFLAALAATAIYFGAPGSVGEGLGVQQRLSLFPPLLLLPSLSLRVGRRTQAAVAVAIALLVAWQAAALTRAHRLAERSVDALLAALAPVPPDQRVLVIVHDHFATFERRALGHAVGYLVAEKRLVDWDDYQAQTDHFPMRLQPGMVGPEKLVRGFQLAAWPSLVDVVMTRDFPLVSPLRAELAPLYTLASDDGASQLWLRPGLQPLPR
jgi:hypothetical protein